MAVASRGANHGSGHLLDPVGIARSAGRPDRSRRSGAPALGRLGGLALAIASLLASTSAHGQAAAPADVAVPPAIALPDAVREALARSPSAVVAYEEVRRAAALVEEVRGAAWPTVYASGAYTRLDGDRRYPGSGLLIAAANQLSANIALSVPLVVPKPWAQWSHASDNVGVANASAADVRRTVAVAVARAYLSVVAQKRVIEAAARACDTDQAHYDFAHQRFVGGVGNRLDEVRAEQQVRSDAVNLQQQYAMLAKYREALGVLVGVGGPLDAEEPTLAVATDPARALEQAERRSDVMAAGARLSAADHVVRDDWTEYSPYLTATLEPFYQDPPTASIPLTGWQAQLILTVPLYDGGVRYGLEKERSALRTEARAQLEGTLRQARSDVRTAFEELKRSDAALASAREAARLAHEALDLAQMAYRAGTSTDIEVIDAERTSRDADTSVAVAEDGSRQARLDLLAATGKIP